MATRMRFRWTLFLIAGLLPVILGSCSQNGPDPAAFESRIETQAENHHFMGFAAQANFDTFQECTATYAWLFVSEGREQIPPGPGMHSAFVDIAIQRFDVCLGEPITDAYGFAEIAPDALQVRSNLNSATLVTTVEAYDWINDSTFEVAVDMTWTGTGELSREKVRQSYSSDGYRIQIHYQGSSRQAQATGSMNDGTTEFAPTPSPWAQLMKARQGVVIVQQGGTSRQPVIDYFFAEPELIAQGESATLSWQVDSKGRTTLTLEPDVGDVSGLTSVTVTPDVTTEYVLTATNRHGSTYAYAVVWVIAPDQHEPNDTAAEATPIPLNFFSPALTVTPGDVDWFTFEVSAPAQVQAYLGTWNLDPVLGLFDGSLAPVALGTFDVMADLDPGTYFLAISGQPDTGFAGAHEQAGFYYFEVWASIPSPPDLYEPNDAPGEATAITLDFFSPELTITPNDDDYFVFTLAETLTVTADVDAWDIGSSLDPMLGLFDEFGSEIEVNDDYNGLDSWIQRTLDAGTYYVAVTGCCGFGSHGQDGFYFLNVTATP